MIGRSAGEASTGEITVRVLFFSVLREQVGRGELELSVKANSRSEELLDRLSATYPAVDEFRSVTRVAVNQSYVDGSVELMDGDEMALITPVSGG